MNIFDNGIAMLKTAMEKSMETEVTYTRGTASYSLKAVRGSVSWGTLQKFGDMPADVTYREYLVRIDALPTGIMPAEGDKITDLSDIFEVTRMADTTCYRYSDPQKQIIRIYTRKIQ